MNDRIFSLASHSLVVDGCRINKMLSVEVSGSRVLRVEPFIGEKENTIFINKEIIFNSIGKSSLKDKLLSEDFSIKMLNDFFSSGRFEIIYKL